MPIWVFCLILTCVQDRVINGLSNRHNILVPQTCNHLRKFRSVTVSLYGKFHVQVCVIIKILGEVIVSLWNTGFIDYVDKILLEVWFMFQVLQPVLCVMLFSVMCEFLLLPEVLAYIDIQSIDTGSSLEYIFLAG